MRWRSLLIGLTVHLATTGCLGNLFDGRENFLVHQDLQATDHDRLFPGGRVSYQLSDAERERRIGLYELVVEPAVERASDAPTNEQRAPAFRSSVALEAEYAVGLGGDDRRTTLGTVEYDEIDIATTSDLEFDYDLHLATLGASGGVRIRDFLRLDALTGLSVSALRLEISNATQRVQDTGVSMGWHFGSRIGISPHPVFDVFAEGKLHLMGGLQGSRRFVFVPEAMAAGSLHLTRNVSVFGGYRWWRYRENIESASDLDDLVIEGPTFGIQGRF